jgi:hypothetical protein
VDLEGVKTENGRDWKMSREGMEGVKDENGRCQGKGSRVKM